MGTSKRHWDAIYTGRPSQEMSWYEPSPETSLSFIQYLRIPEKAAIIDVGGGDSLLADHLLKMGYRNITVLDISAHTLERAKKRLGRMADKVKWIETDILDFKSEDKYDFWHDRALFHFLDDAAGQQKYLEIAHEAISANGSMVIGTFSIKGPHQCSGLPVHQYSEKGMTNLLRQFFVKIKCVIQEHPTPFNTVQEFLFCSFRKLTPT